MAKIPQDRANFKITIGSLIEGKLIIITANIAIALRLNFDGLNIKNITIDTYKHIAIIPKISAIAPTTWLPSELNIPHLFHVLLMLHT